MDYGIPDKRKNKNDWKAKRRFNKYKTGGALRSSNIYMSNEKKESK